MKKKALFVGIDNYEYINKLNCAVADANELRNFFRDRAGFETDTLLNEAASYPGQICEKISDTQKGLDSGDLLLIFMAGHGVDVNHDKCFICCKTEPGDPEREKRGCLRLIDIDDKIKGPQNTIVIIDACRTDIMLETAEKAQQYQIHEEKGAVTRSFFTRFINRGKSEDEDIKQRDIDFLKNSEESSQSKQSNKRGPIVWLFSCQKGETAAEFNGHGLFTRSLLDLLEGSFSNGDEVFVDDNFRKSLNRQMEKVASNNLLQKAEIRCDGGVDGIVLLPGYRSKQKVHKDCIEDAVKPPSEGKNYVTKLPGDVTLPVKWCMATTSGDWTNEHKVDWFDMGARAEEDGANCFVPCDRHCAETLHRVQLTYGFWIGETEVTQKQWKSLMGTTVIDLCAAAFDDNTAYEYADTAYPDEPIFATFKERKGGKSPEELCYNCGEDVPVYFTNWNDAKAFCAKLTEIERTAGRLPDGYVWRLPTEAEWEYACRAGRTTTLPNGEKFRINGSTFIGSMDAPALDNIAWYGGNSSYGYEGRGANTKAWERYGKRMQYKGGRAAPRYVFGKEANAWGIRDMLGNVWEWCEDWLNRIPQDNSIVKNPVQMSRPADESLCYRVARGGSWYSDAQECRPATRWRFMPGFRNWTIGFRVVLAPEISNDGIVVR